jgi:hypothetical protein
MYRRTTVGEYNTPGGFWDKQSAKEAGPTLEEQERLRACSPEAVTSNLRTLPEYLFCAHQVAGHTASNLELFIYEMEPEGDSDAKAFRDGLLAVLNEARGDWEAEPCQCAKCTAVETPAERSPNGRFTRREVDCAAMRCALDYLNWLVGIRGEKHGAVDTVRNTLVDALQGFPQKAAAAKCVCPPEKLPGMPNPYCPVCSGRAVKTPGDSHG